MQISIATGILSIDRELKQKMKDKYNVESRIINYRRDLERESESVVVLSENLCGEDIEFIDLLYALKKRNKTIVLLLNSEDDTMFFKALKMRIFDILFTKNNDSIVDSIIDTLEHPKTASDYLAYFKNDDDEQTDKFELNLKQVIKELSDEDKRAYGLIEEKIIEVPVVSKETIEIERVVSFDKKVFAIWGNNEFGCEFAYTLAKLQKNKEILVVDLNIQCPSLTVYFNTELYSQYKGSERSYANQACVSIVLDLLSLGETVTSNTMKQIAIKRNDRDNLYLFSAEQYLQECDLKPPVSVVNLVKSLINTAYKNLDITVLLCNESIIDPYTICAMENADYILAARRQNSDELNALFNHINYLKGNKNIKLDSIKYIAFDYIPSYNLDESIVKNKQIFDFSKRYIGHISHSERRMRIKNSTHRIYASRMDDIVISQYVSLFSVFNITCKYKRKHVFFHRIGKLAKKPSQLIGKVLGKNGSDISE